MVTHAKVKPRYLRNRRSRVIHKQPTREACNWDAVPKKYRERLSALVIRHDDRLCAYCFREGAA